MPIARAGGNPGRQEFLQLGGDGHLPDAAGDELDEVHLLLEAALEEPVAVAEDDLRVEDREGVERHEGHLLDEAFVEVLAGDELFLNEGFSEHRIGLDEAGDRIVRRTRDLPHGEEDLSQPLAPDVRLDEDEVSVLEVEMLLDISPEEAQMPGLPVESDILQERRDMHWIWILFYPKCAPLTISFSRAAGGRR